MTVKKCNMNKTYTGSKEQTSPVNVLILVLVKQEGQPTRELKADESLKLANKSPDGFNWGYGGSGPSQLALALLLDHTGQPGLALTHFHDFKWATVATWGDQWTLTSEQISQWLKAKGVQFGSD